MLFLGIYPDCKMFSFSLVFQVLKRTSGPQNWMGSIGSGKHICVLKLAAESFMNLI